MTSRIDTTAQHTDDSPSREPGPCQDDGQPSQTATVVEIPSPSIRSAIDVMQALKNIHSLPSLGRCPTGELAVREKTDSYKPSHWREEKEITIDLSHKAALKELQKLHRSVTANVASGHLSEPFRLSISRSGCQFDGLIRPIAQGSMDEELIDSEKEATDEELSDSEEEAMDKKLIDSEEEAIMNRLEQWYQNSAISGYGDVEAQETKVNPEIRCAREIPSDEFSIEPELLKRIEECWNTHFHINKGVRVEPYKIHIYGEGGHFKVHRDTPEKNLVGTFLLGLGDTTEQECLQVDGKEFGAPPCSWVAFYPDVPHAVDEVCEGHRAVVAFKLFRQCGSEEPDAFVSINLSVKELTDEMQAPFGILLQRKYCLGTTELSGFDAVLRACISARSDVKVILLPVVVDVEATWGTHEDDVDENWEQDCATSVRPFSEAHIDYLLDDENEIKRNKAWQIHDGIKNVPFYSLDFDASVVVWKDEEEETCNFVGNEAQAWRQDSVYLSYALIVLPKEEYSTTGRKRKREEGEC